MAVIPKAPSVYIVVMDEDRSEVITISDGATATVENGWANSGGDFDPDPWAFSTPEIAASFGYFPASRRTYTMIDAKGVETSRIYPVPA